MRFKYLYLTATLLLACFLIGCNSAESKIGASVQKDDKKTPPQTTYSDGARRITITELQDLIKKGDAFIVDVRNQASYDSGHIPGAKLIPAGEILNHLDELPKGKTIVTYCS
jgi:3-mercaptopyruvate sulfurtransferase SseA